MAFQTVEIHDYAMQYYQLFLVINYIISDLYEKYHHIRQ